MTEGQRFALSKALAFCVSIAIVVGALFLLKRHGDEQRAAGYKDCAKEFLAKGTVAWTPHEAVLVPLGHGTNLRLWTRVAGNGGLRVELWENGELLGWDFIKFNSAKDWPPEWLPKED
jgi:hypothetical protein